MYGAVSDSTGNKTYPSANFSHDQRSEPQSRNLQDGLSVASASTVSSSGAANLEYANYATPTATATATATYPNNDPYGYGNTGYAGYYNSSYQQQQPNQSYPQQQPNQSYPQQQQQPNQSYPQQQQQPNHSYPQQQQQQPNQSYPQQQPNQSSQTYVQPSQTYVQQAGAYQSTGAPHQPISSFQNTGSYPGPASYSTTYYNPGDYQTSGGYPTANYNTQTNSWNQGSYPSYAHQYPNYTTDSNVAYTAQNNTPVASVQYQQDYSKQWTDYYSQTEVTCAPGTENVSSTSAPNLVSPLPVPVPVPVVANAYSAPNNQQVASTAPVPSSWKPESGLSELPSVQPSAAINNVHESYWKQGSQGYQNYHVTPMQSGFQKPLEAPPQRPNVQQYTASHQVPQTYQPPPQTSVPFGVNKVQIPTNPRISSNLPKNHNSTIGPTKPAYIGVSLPNPNDNTSSHAAAAAADSTDKPGTLPKSLRGYVERALARCKDDRQMAACQNVLKEVITKASTEGTLSTRDWDTEPLFPIPNTDTINNESTPPSLMKNRRSPSRRAKSRWEPLPDEKPVEKQSFFTPESVKSSGGFHSIERDKQFSTGKPENKESNKFSNLRFFLSNQKEANKSGFRPAKRQHIGEGKSAPVNHNNNNNNNDSSSSDSDKEQGLTAYYASAITLADSPEEKKRRESRSKRFEKNHGNRTTFNNNNNNNKNSNNNNNTSSSYERPNGTIAGLEAINFITLATPHLGVRGNKQLPFLLGVPILERIAAPMAPIFVGRTGSQLFLTDGRPDKPPLLLRMTTDCDEGKYMSALGAFRHRILYANASYDHMVGRRTSSIRRESELVKPPLQFLDGYKHVVDVEYCPPVLSTGASFPPEAARAKEAAQNVPNPQNTLEYHEILEEEMICGLQQLGWKKVDVSFHSSFWPFFAHNNIHVKDEWFHKAGAGVVSHVADTINQQEKQHQSSSFISASL